MTIPRLRPIPEIGFMTTWVNSRHVNVLCRSADWYKMPPIHRYLMNMAANHIGMEDAKTERREYTYERFDHLRKLIERSASQEWDVAFEAVLLWRQPELTFGVVHLEQGPENRGDRLLGDDPDDFARFASLDLPIVDLAPLLMPSHGVEGSDA